MPWVNLTQDEVEELRNKKHELTEYGRKQIRKMIKKNNYIPDNDTIEEMTNVKLTHEEMIEIAEEREKLNAGFKKDENGNWYRPTLEELTRNERIELAEKEIAYMVMGGQDGREYANSIAFLLQVLDSLRDKEDEEFEDSANGVA